MALGAGTLTARGVALSGWQRRAQLLAPPILDSLEPPGWLGAWLDFGFPAPPFLLEARAGAARVGSHWQSCDCPPRTANHPLWSWGKYLQPGSVACARLLFFSGKDEITNPLSLRRVRVLFIIMVHSCL